MAYSNSTSSNRANSGGNAGGITFGHNGGGNSPDVNSQNHELKVIALVAFAALVLFKVIK